MSKIADLKLPEFAFVEGSWHEKGGDPLEDRIVILHIRSGSVIEMFNRPDVVLNDDVLTYKFSYIDYFNIKEPMIAVLHYCATLDVKADKGMIKENIMKPAAKWFCDYLLWEDKNIINKSMDE